MDPDLRKPSKSKAPSSSVPASAELRRPEALDRMMALLAEQEKLTAKIEKAKGKLAQTEASMRGAAAFRVSLHLCCAR
jgi:hypothetical protein